MPASHPRLLVVVALMAAVVVGCSRGGDQGGTDAASAPAVGRSSTIAWSADGDRLWLTSPDDDAVVAVDPDSLEQQQRIEVAGEPEELAVLGERVLVTGAQRTSLAVVDAEAGDVADEVALPCGGLRAVSAIAAGVAGADRDLAVVTCPSDDLVAVVDVDAGTVLASTELPGRPAGVVHDGEQLVVTTEADAAVRTWDLASAVAAAERGDPLGEPDATEEPWADDGRTASLLGPVDLSSVGPVASYQIVDNQRKLSSKQLEEAPGYGDPVNGRARLEPAVAGRCGARFADFGEEPRRLAMPSAIASAPDQDLIWVVGRSSRSVSVVRCRAAGASRSTTVAAFDVGDGPRGIVLSPDGATAWVDVGFDHQVARLELPAGAAEVAHTDPIERTAPVAVGDRPVGDQHLSALAQEGRSAFTDATDPELTPFGVLSCASCHPAAGDDGLRWRIETHQIHAKLRRTPPVWQVDPEAKPLHWDGEFTTVEALVRTTVDQLLGGDPDAVDGAAIAAYLAEAQGPPPAPLAGDEADQARRGAELFASLGCATCHTGELGTDGAAHDVLPAADQRAAQLDEVITPSLVAVRARAPFGHDGRAATLADLLAQHRDADGRPFALTDEEAEAVAAYLRTR